MTNTMDHTSRMNQHQTANRNTQKSQAHEDSMTNMMDRTSHTHPGPPMITMSSTTSHNTVSDVFHKDQTITRKHPNTKL